MLLYDGDEATDEADVDGEGGFVGGLIGICRGSCPVSTLGGFLIRCDRLRRRAAEESVSVCCSGGICSVFNFRITSSLACLRTPRFLKLKAPKSSLEGEFTFSRLVTGIGADVVPWALSPLSFGPTLVIT